MSSYTAPEGFRFFRRAKVTKDASGWPVGSVGYYEPPEGGLSGKLWNLTGTDFWYHTLNDNCELTDELVNI